MNIKPKWISAARERKYQHDEGFCDAEKKAFIEYEPGSLTDRMAKELAARAGVSVEIAIEVIAADLITADFERLNQWN